jgi:hypothetical protein
MTASRLLDNLLAQASSTNDQILWAKTVCRASSHFSRHGRTQEALNAIGNVRKLFNNNLPFEIASWLMLAEGVLNYFSAKTSDAYDRIQRAYGLAIALRNDSALPACEAWMAHLEFNDCSYEKMVKHLSEAFARSTETDHQARARASLVLANAYSFSGENNLARPWYATARQHAVAEGDEATTSALLYNIAAFHASNLRLDDAFGQVDPKDAHLSFMEASSSINYDDAIGSESLSFLNLMLKAQVLTINKRFSEALSCFDTINSAHMLERMIPSVAIDQAWCKANTGGISDAVYISEGLEAILPGKSEVDDIAYTFARMSQIHRLANDEQKSLRFLTLAESALATHRENQRILLNLLEMVDTK